MFIKREMWGFSLWRSGVQFGACVTKNDNPLFWTLDKFQKRYLRKHNVTYYGGK